MNTKRLLTGLPLIILLLMFQSALWVPTQGRQVDLNPVRQKQYFEATIGDAKILNPILNADSASSEICNKVFDGLIDYDENLNFRGRLATSWKVYEEAFLWVDPTQSLPGGGKATAKNLLRQIQKQIRTANPQSPLQYVESIDIVTAKTEIRALPPQWIEKDLDRVTVTIPPRVRLRLTQVEQDLFTALTPAFGSNYLARINTHTAFKGIPASKSRLFAHEVLPAAEANPIVEFNLRQNVRFHDGHEFSAEDVKFTFDSIMNRQNLSPRTADYEPVKEFQVLHDHKVRIIYKRLYSPALGTWSMGILPKHLLDDAALQKKLPGKDLPSMRDSAFNRQPIGTGAFRFQEWKSDQFIRLKRNEDYWEGAPQYEEFVFRILPDSLGQEMEFYSGTIDGYSPRPNQVNRLKDDPKYQSFSGLSLGYTYIGYNMRREIFKDVRVRKALGMAIDVDSIIDFIYYGHAERITGPFPKQTDYYDRNLSPLPFDPEGALDLLRQAGWQKDSTGKLVHEKTGKPFQFTLITNHGNDLRKGIMTVAQQAWSKLGIQVSTQTIEWTVFLQKHVDQNNFDALILGWSMGIEPDLFQIWHSSQTKPKQLNFVGYNNTKADELIVRIRQEYNKQNLIRYSHELHNLIYEDQPYTFLTVSKWTALLDKRIVRKISETGDPQYARITPTKLGSISFHFNQWIKLKDLADAERLEP